MHYLNYSLSTKDTHRDLEGSEPPSPLTLTWTVNPSTSFWTLKAPLYFDQTVESSLVLLQIVEPNLPSFGGSAAPPPHPLFWRVKPRSLPLDR